MDVSSDSEESTNDADADYLECKRIIYRINAKLHHRSLEIAKRERLRQGEPRDEAFMQDSVAVCQDGASNATRCCNCSCHSTDSTTSAASQPESTASAVVATGRKAADKCTQTGITNTKSIGVPTPAIHLHGITSPRKAKAVVPDEVACHAELTSYEVREPPSRLRQLSYIAHVNQERFS